MHTARRTEIYGGLTRPLIFAHRGASAVEPENTLEAFDAAWSRGVSVLELDVHLTRDGEVVVLHDDTLDRTTDGKGPVLGKTFAQIAALDAGYYFRGAGGAFTHRGRGRKIPRLADVLAAFDGVGFNIEIKSKHPRAIPEVLKVVKSVSPDRVVLAAGNHAVMRRLEAARPQTALGLSEVQVRRVVFAAYLGLPVPLYAGRALQVPPRHRLLPIVTSGVIACAHRVGMEVHVWTLNDPATAARYLSMGVDGIMTDDPARIMTALGYTGRMDVRHEGKQWLRAHQP